MPPVRIAFAMTRQFSGIGSNPIATEREATTIATPNDGDSAQKSIDPLPTMLDRARDPAQRNAAQREQDDHEDDENDRPGKPFPAGGQNRFEMRPGSHLRPGKVEARERC